MDLSDNELKHWKMLAYFNQELMYMLICKEEFKYFLSDEYINWYDEMLHKVKKELEDPKWKLI